jgi:hypothetical protein
VTGLWFTAGTPVSSTNKTEILLKVALNTINQHCDGIYYLILKLQNTAAQPTTCPQVADRECLLDGGLSHYNMEILTVEHSG